MGTNATQAAVRRYLTTSMLCVSSTRGLLKELEHRGHARVLAFRNVEHRVDHAEVCFDRAHGDAEPFGDHRVRVAPRDRPQHLVLPLTQLTHRRAFARTSV